MSSMSGQIALQSAVLFSLRAGLFLSCRRYLLSSLYRDLKDLSAVPVQPGSSQGYENVPTEDPDVEMEDLPTPSTHPTARGSLLKPMQTPLHSRLSRITFAACFSEGCTMLCLLMTQALDWFDPWTRMLNWQFSLYLLLCIIILFIPLSLSIILTFGASSSGKRALSKASITFRLIIYLLPVALYLFLLSYIPLPTALAYVDPPTAILTRLIVIGTVVLGMLSGFGAISNAWDFYALFSRNRKLPTDEDVAAAERSLMRIRDDLAARHAEMQRREAAKPQIESSWFSRMVPNFRSDGQQQEILGLEALEAQMSANLASLRARHNYGKFSNTWKGKVFNWCGRLFAIYSIFRVISSIKNIIVPRQTAANYPDIITHFLAYLLSVVPTSNIQMEDVAALSRQISLALVGVIILSSVRVVLRGVTRTLRITSRNLGASLTLLILAQLMGIYLLSTIVQLRTSFPPPPSRPGADAAQNLFSTVPELEVFGALFDWSFLVCAAATAVVLWMNDRVNGI